MSATREMTIAQLDRTECGLVDVLAGLPATSSNGTGGMRERCLELLEKVRAAKRAFLARSPETLRKASAVGRRAPAEPHWIGIPSVAAEVREIVQAARDRRAEEDRLAKRGAPRETAPEAAMQCVSVGFIGQIIGDRHEHKSICDQVARTLSFSDSAPVPREVFERARYLFERSGCELSHIHLRPPGTG
jgi:hypothetical protein